MRLNKNLDNNHMPEMKHPLMQWNQTETVSRRKREASAAQEAAQTSQPLSIDEQFRRITGTIGSERDFNRFRNGVDEITMSDAKVAARIGYSAIAPGARDMGTQAQFDAFRNGVDEIPSKPKES